MTTQNNIGDCDNCGQPVFDDGNVRTGYAPGTGDYFGHDRCPESKPTERLYTEFELVELCSQVLSSLGHGPDILYCEACRDAIKEPGFDFCADCKCENVCNERRNEFHGRLCADCANDAYDAAYDTRVDQQIDADREAF